MCVNSTDLYNSMLSQNDVTLPFSQNNMPRGRSKSRSVSRSSKKARTGGSSSLTMRSRGSQTKQARTWPYQNDFTYAYMFDPFPAKMMTRMRYSTVVSIDPQAGSPGHHLFRANSIFDPDYTSIGHQPYGHDTMANIYNHYMVTKARIVVTPTYTNFDGIFGIAKVDDVVVSGDYDAIREQKGTNVATGTSAGGQQSVTNYYTAEYFNAAGNALQTAYGTNPNEQFYFDVFYEARDSTTEPSARTFLVNLTYDVLSWELKDLGRS